MRIDAPHVFESGSRRRDQVVNNSQAGFPYDSEIVFEQQVVVLMHRTEKRVFNRRQTVIARSAFDRREHVFKCLAGNKLDGVPEQLARRFATERSGGALK